MPPSRELVKAAGICSKTDKVLHHGYERFYPDFLSEYDTKAAILEIGYGSGQSVQFWKSLYPESYLYLLDRDVELEGEGYRVMRCDQSSSTDLGSIVERLKDVKFNLVIDDGSHIPEHQLGAFNAFFKALLGGGGIYIIEDIETSYWRRGGCYGYPTRYGLDSPRSLVRLFSGLVHWVNREFLDPREKETLCRQLMEAGFDPGAMDAVASISFAHNCIRVMKASGGDAVFADRCYRLRQNVLAS